MHAQTDTWKHEFQLPSDICKANSVCHGSAGLDIIMVDELWNLETVLEELANKTEGHHDDKRNLWM